MLPSSVNFLIYVNIDLIITVNRREIDGKLRERKVIKAKKICKPLSIVRTIELYIFTNIDQINNNLKIINISMHFF